MDGKTIIGYHGTDKTSAQDIIQTQKFNKSNNMDDWLGRGIYFYDDLNNAILYNIRKYKNKKRNYPTYEQLSEERKVIIVEIQCNEEDILDLNEIENISKFLELWKMFYEKVKDNSNYKKSDYKDGYMINWIFDNTDFFRGCKIFMNIFSLDLRFRRRINPIFNKKTRIGYTLQQKYICVVDDECIKSISLHNKNYEDEYNNIRELTNNILMIGE